MRPTDGDQIALTAGRLASSPSLPRLMASNRRKLSPGNRLWRIRRRLRNARAATTTGRSAVCLPRDGFIDIRVRQQECPVAKRAHFGPTGSQRWCNYAAKTSPAAKIGARARHPRAFLAEPNDPIRKLAEGLRSLIMSEAVAVAVWLQMLMKLRKIDSQELLRWQLQT